MPLSPSEWAEGRTVDVVDRKITKLLEAVYPRALTRLEVEVGLLAQDQGIPYNQALLQSAMASGLGLLAAWAFKTSPAEDPTGKALQRLHDSEQIDQKEIQVSDGLTTTYWRARPKKAG